MDECETELKFKINGQVEGLTERARETIRILNLGDCEKSNKSLIEKRKKIIYSILLSEGIDPSEGLDDDDLLNDLMDKLAKPDDKEKLESFSPIIINVLKQWLIHNK